MRKLNEIIADAQQNVMEACAAGYADGLNMGMDMAIDKRDAASDELCDAFIRVWNERYDLREKVDELEGQMNKPHERADFLPCNYLGDEFVYCTDCKHYHVYERNGANEWMCERHQIADPGYGYCYWGERK